MDEILAMLRQWQPDAYSLRPSGRCPICKQDTEYSYLLPQHNGTHTRRDGTQAEYCGYWCSACGWANAGSRAIE